MRCQSCMWDSQAYVDIFFDQGQKFHSISPESITLHPARLAPRPKTGLKYQNLMGYDCMRDSSKRSKNKDFPHIPYYHIPKHFTSDEEKKTLQAHFFQKNGFWLYATVFLVYYAFCGVRRSVSICGVRWGPLECHDTPSAMPHEYARREIP